jgi:shikimate dehydrogenase
LVIDSTTRLYGLIGNPVSGSRSPWIHNTLFEVCGLPGAYLAFQVAPEALKDAVAGLRALNPGGLNVTIPYKTDIMAYLDSIDPMAEALGAVNTIVNQAGHWRGFNTDGSGLLAVLKRKLPDLENRQVLILGAGGAARGICGALLVGGVQRLGIWNRTEDRISPLISDLKALADTGQTLQAVTAPDGFKGYDLVINTTSVGMEPDTDKIPMDVSLLSPGAVVCDIVYKPHWTRLLREAADAGHPVIHGIEMLIEQALLAEKLWNQVSEEALDKVRSRLVEEFESSHK